MARKQATSASRTEQPTQTVKALVPINHDDTDYEVDDVFDVGSDCVPQLLEVNAVEVVKTPVSDLPTA